MIQYLFDPNGPRAEEKAKSAGGSAAGKQARKVQWKE